MEIIKEQPLLKYNTFGINSTASHFAIVKNIDNLRNLLRNEHLKSFPLLVLGGGSNILFTKDFTGLVLKNEIKGIQVIKENDEHVWVKAGAGEKWHDLVLYSIDHKYAGMENLSLIPGTVGAAPIQNIGAYGVELKDVFDSLEAINLASLEMQHFTNAECEFGYRESLFKKKRKGEFIITSVTFKLSKNPVLNISYGAIQEVLKENNIEHPSIKDISNAVISIRKSKLPDPDVIGNAGSFFKNPEISESVFQELKSNFPGLPSFPARPGMVKIPAGWLIEHSGWKGKVVGNTGVHKNQALVLVNYGNASGIEVKNLSDEIRESVKKNYGIELESEVNLL